MNRLQNRFVQSENWIVEEACMVGEWRDIFPPATPVPRVLGPEIQCWEQMDASELRALLAIAVDAEEVVSTRISGSALPREIDRTS